MTDLWKLKEEAIAKQGKAEVRVVVLVMDDNLDGIDDDGDEKYHRRWEMEVAPPHKTLYTQRVRDVDGTDGLYTVTTIRAPAVRSNHFEKPARKL